MDTSGHGKLLVDESIFPLAYAPNVNEQVLEVQGPDFARFTCVALVIRDSRVQQQCLLSSSQCFR